MKTSNALEDIGPRTWSNQELEQAYDEYISEFNSLTGFCYEFPVEHYLQAENPDPARLLAAITLLGMIEGKARPAMAREMRRRGMVVPTIHPYAKRLAGQYVEWAKQAAQYIEPSEDRKFLASCGITEIS